MDGRYATRPTAVLEAVSAFMTWTHNGVTLRDPKPTKPPSHERFIRAGWPPAGIPAVAFRINNPYSIPAP